MAVRFPEAGARRFWPHPHAGHETKDADTHVESHDDVLSDAGSTPAASTISKYLIRNDLQLSMAELYLELRASVLEAAGVALGVTTQCGNALRPYEPFVCSDIQKLAY